MLIPFSIDPEALGHQGADLSAIVACHRRVIQQWRKHGVLIHSHGALRDSSLLRMVEKLPQECRKLWKAALSSTRRKPSLVPWDGTFPNNELSELSTLSGQFNLALLESTRAQAVCGLDIHEASRFFEALNGMELCKFHSACESSNFSQAETLATQALEKGENCGQQWKERYSSHIKHATHITVVDRYIVANHLHRLFKKELSGLTRLLTDAFNRPSNRQVNIKIFSAIQNIGKDFGPEDHNVLDEFIDNLTARYKGGGIGKLEVYVLRDKDFSRHAHARYFRTDYSIFGIDRGLDSFGGYNASNDTLVWRDDTGASPIFSKQEANLQGDTFKHSKVI